MIMIEHGVIILFMIVLMGNMMNHDDKSGGTQFLHTYLFQCFGGFEHQLTSTEIAIMQNGDPHQKVTFMEEPQGYLNHQNGNTKCTPANVAFP